MLRKIIDWFGKYFEKISDWFAKTLLGKTRWIVVLLLLFTAVSVVPCFWLQIDAGTEKYTLKDSSRYLFLDKLNQNFVISDPVFIALQYPDIFSHDALETVKKLQEELRSVQIVSDKNEKIVAVDDITSLLTVKDIKGSDLNFETIPLVPDPIPTAESDLKEIKKRALNNPIIRDNLISSDTSSTLLAVRMQEQFSDKEIGRALSVFYDILEKHNQQPERIYSLSMAGYPVQEYQLNRYQLKDLALYVPIIVLIMCALFFVFVRKVISMLAAALTMGISLAATIAWLTVTGGSIHLTTTLLVVVIPTVATSYTIHYLSEFGKYRKEFPNQDYRMMTIKQLLFPVFISAFTTSLGFFSISSGTHLESLDEFASSSGVGVLAVFFVVVSIMAILIKVFPAEKLVSEHGLSLSTRFDWIIIKFCDLIIKYRKTFLWGSVLIVAIAAGGIFLIEADWDTIAIFPKSSKVRTQTEMIDDHFGGVTSFVVSIEHAKEEQFTDPLVLKKIDELSRILKNRDDISRVTSFVDYLKLMNREFFNGDAEAHQIPDSAQKVSQLLLLNTDERVREYVNEKNNWVRIVSRKKIHAAQGILALTDQIQAQADQLFPSSEGYTCHVTGKDIVHSEFVTTLTSGQVSSLVTGFVSIFVLLFVLFRSWTLGLLSIPPNIAPIFLGLGCMGFLGIKLGPSTALLASAALGIAVDDTVHFLKEARERLSEHGDLERALREMFHMKGAGVLWTCVVLCFGFAVTISSNFLIIREFGIIFVITIFSSVVIEITMLPSLLLVLKTKLGLKKHEIEAAIRKHQATAKQ